MALGSPSNVCRALLTDGKTRCSVALPFEGLSCATHRTAYDASYQNYKEAEREVEESRKAARLSRREVRRLLLHEIDPRMQKVRVHVDALSKELALREEHILRFIGTPDIGHCQRLERLRRQVTHHCGILQALRERNRRLCQGTKRYTPARRTLGTSGSRVASPAPRSARKRRGPRPREELRAKAREEGCQRLLEERERQHSAVVDAAKRRNETHTRDEEAFLRDSEAAILLSQMEQHDAMNMQRAGIEEPMRHSHAEYSAPEDARYEDVDRYCTETRSDRSLDESIDCSESAIQQPHVTSDALIPMKDERSSPTSTICQSPVKQVLDLNPHGQLSDDAERTNSIQEDADMQEQYALPSPETILEEESVVYREVETTWMGDIAPLQSGSNEVGVRPAGNSETLASYSQPSNTSFYIRSRPGMSWAHDESWEGWEDRGAGSGGRRGRDTVKRYVRQLLSTAFKVSLL
ncbi:hypothetical protein BD311DRAFT_498029 [Dichomitus squalens]|uniref:Uncharacterized protein n=1 Tax=Dichomitus squalens TaxID=114155 RepID=A0A4Q9MFU1_9APHY|nr:hypothetical protein BD311DRAFT_498029 [Dichomitus squalens]